MRRNVIYRVSSVVALCSVLCFGGVASAHSAEGESFVTINGEHVLESTNPYVDYDLAPVHYQTGKSVTFMVEPAGADVLPTSSFRWMWGDGTADGGGIKTSHSFAQDGQHLVTLQVDAPGDPVEYKNLDTIQLTTDTTAKAQSNDAKSRVWAIGIIIVPVVAIAILAWQITNRRKRVS